MWPLRHDNPGILNMLAHKIVERWALWRSLRQQRRELLGLSGRTLRDVGLTRDEILLETRSPFLNAVLKKYDARDMRNNHHDGY